MVFGTGSGGVPPLGFDPRPSIPFQHGDSLFPKTNTCAIVIQLPVSAPLYEVFKANMIFGIANSPGFGSA